MWRHALCPITRLVSEWELCFLLTTLGIPGHLLCKAPECGFQGVSQGRQVRNQEKETCPNRQSGLPGRLGTERHGGPLTGSKLPRGGGGGG